MGKDPNIVLPREEEVEKVQALVLACLAHAQQDQVLVDPLHRGEALNPPPQAGKRLDRMLGIVVVPGNPIVLEKGEEAASVFLEALPALQGGLACEDRPPDVPEEVMGC